MTDNPTPNTFRGRTLYRSGPHAAERKLFDEVGLPYFCLDGSWQDHKIHGQAWRFMKVWSQVVEAARQKRRLLFRVRCGNKSRRLFDEFAEIEVTGSGSV